MRHRQTGSNAVESIQAQFDFCRVHGLDTAQPPG
jgi:hypothetical protein